MPPKNKKQKKEEIIWEFVKCFCRTLSKSKKVSFDKHLKFCFRLANIDICHYFGQKSKGEQNKNSPG